MREARPGMMSGSAPVNMIEVTVCQRLPAISPWRPASLSSLWGQPGQEVDIQHGNRKSQPHVMGAAAFWRVE